MSTGAPLTLYNSLTRSLERFEPIDPANVRVYSCGPTVYNYAHIGNLRAYVFTDTLSRVLTWKGFPLTHVINITDVGHLTSDADAGDDKMEAAAKASSMTIKDIAAHYTAAFKTNLNDLNIREPSVWSVATEHIEEMKAFAAVIARNGYTYPLSEEDAPGAAGLYFDVSKLGGTYGKLARSETEAAHSWITEGRIGLVEDKRNAADFALWRTTPPGENRQMEWDSDWGKGAPGWHLECSVMSEKHLGHPFDIHTGGIDHREIHHPNEIAQNQAFCDCSDTGARWWMHNNFLVERAGKMSKSSGDFRTLQTLLDAGVHPLAYRLMCLQAHYRSELEFSEDNLLAVFTRLKRLVIGIRKSLGAYDGKTDVDLADAQIEGHPSWSKYIGELDAAVSDDLNTPRALVVLDEMLADKRLAPLARTTALFHFDAVLGLGLLGSDVRGLTRQNLRLRPSSATLTASDIEVRLADRREARAAKDFARSDAIRDELTAAGVEVMDGDPLGWDWRPAL